MSVDADPDTTKTPGSKGAGLEDGLLRAARSCFETGGLQALCELTRVACVSPAYDADWLERGEILRAAGMLAEWFEGRALEGSSVEVVTIEGRTPLLLAEVGATGGRPGSTALVYGHLDKQPPLGGWREGLQAFEPVLEGDRLYGRGTADDGYSLFAATAAIEALQREGAGHPRVVVLIEASEESGSPDLPAYLDALSSRIGRPSVVVCLDSGCATYDRLWVTTSLRGVISATLRVEVLEQGVHSGAAGGIVPSSFRLLRRLLDRIEDPSTGEMLVPELHVPLPERRRLEIERLVGELGEAAAGTFPSVPGLELSGAGPLDRVVRGTWEPSLSVTGADGLPPVGEAGNVLRPFTALKLSIRTPPTCDVAAAAAAVEERLLADPPEGARVSLAWDSPGSGWESPEPSPWLDEALEEASLECFGRPPGAIGVGGSIPFLAELSSRYPGAQLVATGVLGPESNAHGPNEFLHVPTAVALAGCLAHLLRAVP